MDKLMLIQHPEKFRDSLLASGIKNKKESYPVSTRPEVLEGSWSSSQNAFFGLDDEYTEPASNSTAMEAIVDQTQTLVTGATVKLRLLEDIYIQGNRIPKDELIYGISSLENERLKISIHSIRSQENILPVSLDVYDLDGIEGIYIPGSISRDAGKQSADQAISSMAIASLDPSVGAQAANAGIQAAKTLMSKKIKLVRATLKAGYRVLLVDNHRSS
jgi:conjugative transposon TraM protein